MKNLEEHRKLSFTTFISWYAGLLVASFALAFTLPTLWPVDRESVFAGYMMGVFSLGALRRPEILFQILRSTGWFALIESDRVMQFLLGAVALLMATALIGWWSFL